MACALAFAAIRAASLLHVDPFLTADTGVYLEMSQRSLTDPVFWGGLRPVFVPLFYKVCASNVHGIVFGQATVGILAWIGLAGTLARRMRTPVAAMAIFATVLLFGLSDLIIRWDAVILSESLSITTTVALLASLLWLRRGDPAWKFGVVFVLVAVWMTTRESHTYLGLLLATFFVVAALYSWLSTRTVNWKYAALGVATFGCFVLNSASSDHGERWFFPFLNVTGRRVLVDSSKTQWFAAHGMPLNAAVRRMQGKWASDDDWAFYKAPDLESFRVWAHASGKNTYESFLLNHPRFLLTAPLADWQLLVASDRFVPYAPRYRGPLRGLDPLLWIASPKLLIRWSFALLILSTTLAAWKRSWLILGVPLVGSLSLLLLALLVWHGDAMEIGRHSLLTTVLQRLMLWVGSIWLIDAAVSRKRLVIE